MKRLACEFAVAIALMALPARALADDTEIGSWGGSVRPMTSTTVRMAAETVQCICYQGFAEYRVDFRFENAGAPSSVRLGFPFYAGGDTNLPPAGFHAWSDGNPLPITVVHGSDNGEPMDYYVHPVDFRTGATTVTVDYLVSPTSSNIGELYAQAASGTPYAGLGGDLNDYYYTLHTGANWAGTIGTAVLRWSLAPDFAGWGAPNANEIERRYWIDDEPEYRALLEQQDAIQRTFTQPDPRTYQWVLRDVEPTESAHGMSAYDIGLHYFMPSGWDKDAQLTQYGPRDVAASSWLKLGDYEYPPDAINDGDPSTAWAEDASGPGIGQHVDFSFFSPQEVREVRILPGYAKRADLFAKYNRPKRVRIDYSDGSSQVVTLADDPSLQRFQADAFADSARLTILDVYRGTTRNETYVSEVEFGTGAAPRFLPFAQLLRESAEASAAAKTGARSPANPAALGTARTPAEPPHGLPLLALAILGGSLVGVSLVLWREA